MDMDRMDLLEAQKVSVFLSRHLDHHYAIGSEKNINVKRFQKYVADKLHVTPKESFISTGSKSEGLNFAKSDDDMMITLNEVIVVQPHDEIPERDVGKTILAMDNTDCRPGYTLLRVHQDRNSVADLNDAMIYFNGSTYLSSVVCSSNWLVENTYLNGPSRHYINLNDGETDIAFSFHCRSWPDHLSNFGNRTRYCVWPSRHLVNYIINHGCHFVAIGDKHSRLFGMQWRISFASAEKYLVWSFNHVQLKTYALLKMFLREGIERDQSINELLCSYFMKTIVFHAIEHATPSMWVDENIVQCFWYCFTILLECVQTGYLPNYFILTHNMFLSNVTGENRRRLLRVLNRYQCMGYTCLFQCPSLQALPRNIQENPSMYPSSRDLRLQEMNEDVELFRNTKFHGHNCTNIANALKLINRVFLKSSDDNFCDLALLHLIRVITSVFSKCIADLTYTNHKSNKTVYKQIRRHKRFLHLSSATDVCNGLLSLATFYYNVGAYTKASDVALRVVFACQQSGLLQDYGSGEEYFEEICGKGYTLLQKAKRSFVFNYTISKKGNKLYPPELDVEVKESKEGVELPQLPYALFLCVLSTFSLGNIAQSQVILKNLMAVRTNPIYGVCHYPILHNLVGICHRLLGNTREAVKAFEESCRQLPDNPAALIRIAALPRTRKEQKSNTNIDALDYYNVPFQVQSNDSTDNDDDVYCQKAMYAIDPYHFIEMSWF